MPTDMARRGTASNMRWGTAWLVCHLPAITWSPFSSLPPLSPTTFSFAFLYGTSYLCPLHLPAAHGAFAARACVPHIFKAACPAHHLPFAFCLENCARRTGTCMRRHDIYARYARDVACRASIYGLVEEHVSIYGLNMAYAGTSYRRGVWAGGMPGLYLLSPFPASLSLRHFTGVFILCLSSRVPLIHCYHYHHSTTAYGGAARNKPPVCGGGGRYSGFNGGVVSSSTDRQGQGRRRPHYPSTLCLLHAYPNF